MRMKKSTRGVISVFLSIILVPCIVTSSMFVDLSRVKLAKDMTEAGGDLALNSLLTHYDADLCEYYGLVCSCQNIEEFYDISNDYLVRLLKSQGLSDSEAKTVLYKTSSITGNEAVADLLQINVESSEITEVAGANLTNSTIIKDQIVDFMKYRAPIKIGSEIIEKLGLLGQESNNLENQEKDNELIDEKKEYYEAENELMEKAYDIYTKLIEYQSLEPSDDKVTAVVDHLNSYEEKYKKIHEALAKDLFNTDDIGELKKKVQNFNNYDSTTYKASKKASLNNMKDIYINLAKALTNYKNAKENLKNDFPEYSSSYYDIQYWAQNYCSIEPKLNDVNDASSDIMKYYALMLNAREYLSDDANENFESDSNTVRFNSTNKYGGYDGCTYDETYQWHFDMFCKQVTNLYSSELSKSASNCTSFKYLKDIQSISTNDSNKNAVKSSTHMIDGKSVDDTITDIYNQITADRASMKKFSEKLDGIESDLESLKKLLKTYKKEYEDWKDDAYSYESDLQAEDKTEIEKIEADLGMDDLNEASIDQLKTRIHNMKELYDGLVETIDGFKYGSKKLTDINNTATAKAASGISKNDIPMDETELNEYVESTFKFEPAEAVSVTIDDSNHPSLENEPKLTLWIWMTARFKDVVTDEKKKGDAKYDGYKEQSEEDEDEQTADDVTENNISPAYTNGRFTLGGGLGSLVQLACGLAGDPVNYLTSVRDAFYSTEYVASMFSFYTYEKEGKYDLLHGKYNGKLINMTSYPDAYKSVKDEWTSEKPGNAYNKSLTTNMINATNNYAMGAEWEYILYGNGTSQDNVNTALTEMYIIRFLLNAPSAFLFFWSDSSTDTTAQAVNKIGISVQTATSGIVPAPLVKAVLILVLSALESAHDLEMLKAGLPVKFIKRKDDNKATDDEWFFKIPKPSSDSIDDQPDKVSAKENDKEPELDGLHFSYGDYLYIFLLLAFNNSGLAPDMYIRTANVIQANMNHVIFEDGSGDGWQLNKSRVYFDIRATVRVNPLMLALPIASDYDNNPKDSTDWCTFEYKTTRGYS